MWVCTHIYAHSHSYHSFTADELDYDSSNSDTDDEEDCFIPIVRLQNKGVQTNKDDLPTRLYDGPAVIWVRSGADCDGAFHQTRSATTQTE